MKKNLLFIVITVVYSLSLYAQQKITTQCPHCGHNINITISKEEAVSALQENQDTAIGKQCAAITQKGTKCTRTAKVGSNYCAQHSLKNPSSQTTPKSTEKNKSTSRLKSGSSGQCIATTKSGRRCSRRANSSGYCWQHGK